MEEWREEAKRILMSFDFPIGIADLCRIAGLSVDNISEMYEEIVRISKSLRGTAYALMVEEGVCTECHKPTRFTGKYEHTCNSCGGFVTPPKVCINPR
ncbi:MAG: hypothetical protein ACXACG_18680 [Candidatus Thorarchaeota archaeon]|jgi:predicted Zn-ribbon and HTH transcriptional regulator